MRFKQFRTLALILVLAFPLVLSPGCKKSTPVLPPVAKETPALVAAPSLEFKAQPEKIDYGSSTTLTWSSTNATEVVIDQIGKFPPNGSTVVKPEKTTTFLATANGSGGQSKSQVLVTVVGGPESGAATDLTSGKTRPGVEERAMTMEEIFNNEIKDIFYDFDKYDLTLESREALKKDADVLIREIPQATILIEGHCDERGSEEYNLALGDKRAMAARDLLVSLGVVPTRIKTISYGFERPFDPGHNEAAWAKNRRAHFVLNK